MTGIRCHRLRASFNGTLNRNTLEQIYRTVRICCMGTCEKGYQTEKDLNLLGKYVTRVKCMSVRNIVIAGIHFLNVGGTADYNNSSLDILKISWDFLILY